MAVEAHERGAAAALEALADAARTLAEATSLRNAATALVTAVGRATGADVAVARVEDDAAGAGLAACAVYAVSPALAAELEGSRFPAAELPDGEVDDAALLPAAVARAAERGGFAGTLLVPVRAAGSPAVSVELLRATRELGDHERRLARLAAYPPAAAARFFRQRDEHAGGDGVLALAGEALAAAADAAGTSEHVVRLAAEATGATTALLWRVAAGAPELAAAFGGDDASAALGAAADAAARALGGRSSVTRETVEFGGAATESVTLQLGQPVIGGLQLLFAAGTAPPESELSKLVIFGVRAAQALRASAYARTLELELERTRTVLTVIGHATKELSLQHTLKTALEHTAVLLGTDRVAVYLRKEDRFPAAGRDVVGPHEPVAERLLELLLGPFRARKVLVVEDVLADPLLAPVAGAAEEAAIEAAIGVPLLVQDDVIGLLAAYPPRGRAVTESESALLAALAGQLAIAVQNAQLHEEAKRREAELNSQKEKLERAGRRLEGTFHILESFTTSLSLEQTLQGVARAAVEVLEVDAAVMRMPDERGDVVVPHALHVRDERLVDAAHTILYRSQPLRGRLQRLFTERQPFLLGPDASDAGDTALLAPFLERGWTGAVVPIQTPTGEVIAALSIYSLRPDVPVDEHTLDGAVEIARQAALAIDNARLYQQQKAFADTMQRSLLPRARPQVPGLEVGAAYEASARVDVGGDLYDYLVLPDGRLAVVLGDVTGHGIDATADMAMAKFVFRSLAREHPDPADFLGAANEVVVGEIAPGKFITMLYLTVAEADGTVVCAGAGHPPPRVVGADGTVRSLEARGLVLGVAEGQRYEEVHATLEPGACVVLYTDGVIEARRDGELYGIERLDAFLSQARGLSAQDLADAVLAECQAFSGGELSDDSAVVVVERS